MNNNTKLFGVLIVALFAFGAVGSSAQNGFNQFVEFGDWEFDIGDSNVETYCTLTYANTAGACEIFTTNQDGDFTKGDLYLAPYQLNGDVEEGFVRLFSMNGFEVGSVVQDDDGDEGAAIKNTEAKLVFIEAVVDSKLQSSELSSFFVSLATGNKVAEDDLSLAENMRIDSDHDLVGADVVTKAWKILFADLDDGGSADHDADEPLFADIDAGNTITVGDLALTGDASFTLVKLGDSFLANPTLIDLNNSAADTYYLAVLDQQADFNDNAYRGESILLVRNVTGEGLDAPRVGEYSYVLTGDRQGELIKDGHPFHEEEFASITPGIAPPGRTAPTDEEVVICALVNDADDDAVAFTDAPFFHFDDATCAGNDGDAGDVNIHANNVLTTDADGELDAFLSGFATGDKFNSTAGWKILDLNGDGDVDAGEPIVLDADLSGTLTTLDLVFTTDGASFAGPGHENMAPVTATATTDDGISSGTSDLQYCTYYVEEEDEDGNDIWVAYAVSLRSNYVTSQEGACTGASAEEDVLMGDFVLAGSMHVGEFLTEAAADDFSDGEYSTETGAGQVNYTLMYDDKFPSGFGPEDTVFLVSAGKPKLDEDSFYLGGPSVNDGDDYYFIDTDDLVEFANGAAFELIEGDNRAGLSENDWFYLTSNSAGSIDDETLVVYKSGSAAPVTPETPETPEEPETPETPTEGEGEGEGEGEEEKPQPGFEAIALIAALGAALVLVRRRN